jgi:hypothetical protein
VLSLKHRKLFDEMTAINLNNIMEIRRVGLQALEDALGSVGMTKFIQQYDNGYGDYTKEKYKKPDLTIEEVDKLLRTI